MLALREGDWVVFVTKKVCCVRCKVTAAPLRNSDEGVDKVVTKLRSCDEHVGRPRAYCVDTAATSLVGFDHRVLLCSTGTDLTGPSSC